jgi:poly(3-hydroxybutyrate) depolymerase
LARRCRADGKRGTTLAVEDAVRLWVQLNHAQRAARVEHLPDLNQHDSSTVAKLSYLAPDGTPSVVLYRIEGGGHAEPSPSERYGALYRHFAGQQNADIEYAEEVCRSSAPSPHATERGPARRETP